jgi:hypothetical protein
MKSTRTIAIHRFDLFISLTLSLRLMQPRRHLGKRSAFCL